MNIHDDPLFIFKYECIQGYITSSATSVVIPFIIVMGVNIDNPVERLALSRADFSFGLLPAEEKILSKEDCAASPILSGMVSECDRILDWINQWLKTN